MQHNQVVELIVYYFELFADELLEQKDIPVLVDIVESVYIGPQRSPDLPSVSVLQAL